MNNIQKRFLLFLFGCIVVRLLFTILAKNIDTEKLPYLGYIALLPVIGWFYIIFIGKRDIGGEVFGEQIWWKDLRIIHTILWSIFLYMALNKNTDSWKVLFTDTMFGLLAFLHHHYTSGNFSLLL
jgi:hypothetical protein